MNIPKHIPDTPGIFFEDLIRIRRLLHTKAELAGSEKNTARLMARLLGKCAPDSIITDLGGHGLIAIFQSPDDTPGPTIVFRAELDAVPVVPSVDLEWSSENSKCSHQCGHDGHLSILLGLARRLAKEPPATGQVVLLCQPAEETGNGATAMIDDPRFAELKYDWIFALHNLPGYSEGKILVRSGPFAAGSAGMVVKLTGHSAHAAYPEKSRSPETALTELITALVTLPISFEAADELAFVTIVHARLGQPNFGTTPGNAEIMATLRASTDDVLARLKNAASTLAKNIARTHDIEVETGWKEEFPVTWNDALATEAIIEAAEDLGYIVDTPEESPFRWSEDFGLLAARGKGAMFGLGAGEQHPVLHASDYDFNDRLLTSGVNIFERLVRQIGRSDESN